MQRPSSSLNDTSEGGVNVQVAVRCRPLNNQEKLRNTVQLVHAVPDRRQVKINYGAGAKKVVKTFTFDHVFGQYATQEEVFQETVLPIVDEVLQGYNCTVFAYGQTGTGKTHTMEGDISCAEQAGIIPRSVRSIFEKLDEIKADYSVRVSFLELYNEELQDLLALTDNAARKKPLRLCEDTKRGVTCQNLEEVHVLNADHIFEILARGIEQRQTAATNCNKNSSRSHSIFTLKIMIKELADDGNEAIRHGQLNLVDLAGSECIGRSGAKDQRAREAGNINQSLLTLGRVITAIESLGGRAKTCIIATLSPAQDAVDESLSTLDYAHRAKNIRNKPEINQKLSKTSAMREQAAENETLRLELQAQREKNGVYLPVDIYDNMQATIAAQESQIAEAESVLKTRKQEVQSLKDQCQEMIDQLEQTQQQLEHAEEDLAEKKQALQETRVKLNETTVELSASNAVVGEQIITEDFLADIMDDFREEILSRRGEVTGLQQKIERFEAYQHARIQQAEQFCDHTSTAADSLQASVQNLLKHNEQHSNSLCEGVAELLSRGKDTCETLTVAIAKALEKLQQDTASISEQMIDSCSSVEGHLQKTNTNVAGTLEELQTSLGSWISEVDSSMKVMQSNLHSQKVELSKLSEEVQTKCANNVRLLQEFVARHGEQLQTVDSNMEELVNLLDERVTEYLTSMNQHVTQQQSEMQQQAKNMIQQMTTMFTAFSNSSEQAFGQCQALSDTHMTEMREQATLRMKQIRSQTATVRQSTTTTIGTAADSCTAIQQASATSISNIATHNEKASAEATSIQQSVGAKHTQLESAVSGLTTSVANSIGDSCKLVQQTSSGAAKLVNYVEDASVIMKDDAIAAAGSFNTFMEQHGDVLQDSLHDHFEQLSNQLHNQGHTIADVKDSTNSFKSCSVQELQRTGSTPNPKQFHSLVELRRTRDHEQIRAEVRSARVNEFEDFNTILDMASEQDFIHDTENLSPVESVRTPRSRKSVDSYGSHGFDDTFEPRSKPLKNSTNLVL